MTKPKPTKVSTAARIATLGVLAGMRPRTPLPTLTALVDGAAVLAEANLPADTVRLMLASLRLRPEQEADALAVLYSVRPQLSALPTPEPRPSELAMMADDEPAGGAL